MMKKKSQSKQWTSSSQLYYDIALFLLYRFNIMDLLSLLGKHVFSITIAQYKQLNSQRHPNKASATSQELG